MNELALFLATCLVKLHPPHMSAAQLDRAMEQQWTEHHFSVELNCFICSLCWFMWEKIHILLPSLYLNYLILEHQEGFNTCLCLLVFTETTALTNWRDHLKCRMTNVFPAQHRGIVDLCHGRMRVELFCLVLRHRIKDTTWRFCLCWCAHSWTVRS